MHSFQRIIAKELIKRESKKAKDFSRKVITFKTHSLSTNYCNNARACLIVKTRLFKQSKRMDIKNDIIKSVC